MKRIVVFPGQGSQQVGMGRDLAGAFASARLVFEEVNEALGMNLSNLMFEGPEDVLTLTENAQPAIMASSMALLRVLETETGFVLSHYAQYVAGHSLGEYTALAATQAISLADTARLLRLRGQAMQKAVPAGEGAMMAILGLEFEQVSTLAKEASAIGVCAIANDNSPGQIVVSGSLAAVESCGVAARELGAKRALMLPVSAPFHSPLMQPAADAMRVALATTTIHTPTLPVIANVTAEPVHDVDTIRTLLVEQVTGMVRWRESVHHMKDLGITQALEIGVGKVLTGLIKRTEKEIDATCIAGLTDIDQFAKVA